MHIQTGALLAVVSLGLISCGEPKTTDLSGYHMYLEQIRGRSVTSNQMTFPTDPRSGVSLSKVSIVDGQSGGKEDRSLKLGFEVEDESSKLLEVKIDGDDCGVSSIDKVLALAGDAAELSFVMDTMPEIPCAVDVLTKAASGKDLATGEQHLHIFLGERDGKVALISQEEYTVLRHGDRMEFDKDESGNWYVLSVKGDSVPCMDNCFGPDDGVIQLAEPMEVDRQKYPVIDTLDYEDHE